MHEYVAKTVDRTKVVWTLAWISIVASAGIGALFHQLKVPTWIAPPTGAAVFGLVFLVFNHFLWRLEFISKIPNLRGTWTGTVEIHQGEAAESDTLPCTVWIRQTWTAIEIKFKTDKSKSHSVTAAINPSGYDAFHYEYDVTVENNKTLVKNSTMTEGRHYGTAHLSPVGGHWDELEGNYYNDKPFQVSGQYTIKRGTRQTKSPRD